MRRKADDTGEKGEVFIEEEEGMKEEMGENQETNDTFGENGVFLRELDEIVQAAGETDGGEQEEEIAGDVDDEHEERGEVHDCAWGR